MIKFPLRRIINLFRPQMRQMRTFRDVLAKYDKGDFKGAYTSLCSVLKIQSQWSKDGDVYTLWAELELRVNNNPDKAQELLARAHEIGCSEMGYYYNVYGTVMLRKNDCERAICYFEQSVDIDPSVPNLIMLAQAVSMVDDKRALSIWEQVLEKDSENCFAHVNIGWQAARSGDRNKARTLAKKAETLRSTAEDAAEIGRLYHELEEFQSAIDAYLEADKLGYEQKALIYAAIADCYSSLDQKSTARKYVQRAMRQDPDNDYVKDVWREYQEKFEQR